MLMNRRLQSVLDNIKPRDKVLVNAALQQKTLRSFLPGDPVFIKNFGRGDRWLPAVVESCSGLTIRAVCSEGTKVYRHINHTIQRSSKEKGSEVQRQVVKEDSASRNVEFIPPNSNCHYDASKTISAPTPLVLDQGSQLAEETSGQQETPEVITMEQQAIEEPAEQVSLPLRRSSRTVKPPERLNL